MARRGSRPPAGPGGTIAVAGTARCGALTPRTARSTGGGRGHLPALARLGGWGASDRSPRIPRCGRPPVPRSLEAITPPGGPRPRHVAQEAGAWRVSLSRSPGQHPLESFSPPPELGGAFDCDSPDRTRPRGHAPTRPADRRPDRRNPVRLRRSNGGPRAPPASRRRPRRSRGSCGSHQRGPCDHRLGPVDGDPRSERLGGAMDSGADRALATTTSRSPRGDRRPRRLPVRAAAPATNHPTCRVRWLVGSDRPGLDGRGGPVSDRPHVRNRRRGGALVLSTPASASRTAAR